MASDPLELEMQTVGIPWLWVLGMELGSFARVLCSLYCEAVSPAPGTVVFILGLIVDILKMSWMPTRTAFFGLGLFPE